MVATVEGTGLVERGNHERSSWRDRMGIPALVLATLISGAGNYLTAIAIPWFVYATTGSAARTGLVAFAGLLPVFVAGLAGGLAVDRLGFKRASVIADIASGLTVVMVPTLYLLDALAYWHLLVLTFLGALLDVPGHAARTALIPGLANRVGMPLERANAAVQLATAAASVVGPLTAGLVIAAAGATTVLFVDAASFGLSALIVGLVIIYRRPSSEPDDTASDHSHISPLTKMFSGVRFLLGNRLLATIITISLFANFLFSPLISVIYPVYVKETFDSAAALGYLVAGFGAGSVIGTLAYGAVGNRISRFGVFAVGATLMTIGSWLLPASPTIALSVFASTLIGTAVGPVNALAMVLLQERVPEALLGRVISSISSLVMLAAPLGVLIASFGLEVFPPRWVLFMQATGVTAIALAVILIPTMREMDNPVEVKT